MKREREREDGAERQRDERKEGQNKKRKKKKKGKDVGWGQNRNISCLSVSRLACEVQLMPLRWLRSAPGIHAGLKSAASERTRRTRAHTLKALFPL